MGWNLSLECSSLRYPYGWMSYFYKYLLKYHLLKWGLSNCTLPLFFCTPNLFSCLDPPLQYLPPFLYSIIYWVLYLLLVFSLFSPEHKLSNGRDSYPVLFFDVPWGPRTGIRWWCGSVAKSCLTLATPWTVTYQAPLSMRFPRQEYWSGLPFSSPGDLPDPGIEPRSPASQTDSLLTELWGKPRHMLSTQ